MKKYQKIRTEIKRLSEQQKLLKPQRKESFEGERWNERTEYTAGQVQENKWELRHLFEAYAQIKGVIRPEIKKESNFTGLIIDKNKLESLVKKYKPIEEDTSVGL